MSERLDKLAVQTWSRGTNDISKTV